MGMKCTRRKPCILQTFKRQKCQMEWSVFEHESLFWLTVWDITERLLWNCVTWAIDNVLNWVGYFSNTTKHCEATLHCG